MSAQIMVIQWISSFARLVLQKSVLLIVAYARLILRDVVLSRDKVPLAQTGER